MKKNSKEEITKELNSLRQVLFEIVGESGITWYQIAKGAGIPHATLSAIKHCYYKDTSFSAGSKLCGWISQHYPHKIERIKELLELPF